MSLSPRPKGYRNYIADWPLDDPDLALAKKLARDIASVTFELQADSTDVAVVAVYPGLFWKKKRVLGYLPKDVQRLAQKEGKLESAIPILHNIWHGDRKSIVYMTLLEAKTEPTE